GNGSDEDAEHDIGQEMEVTFHSGLECLNKKLMEKKNKRSETVLEASLRQRREKKKANKNKLKCLSDDDSDQQAIGADEFFIEEPLCLEEEEGTK
ncbi:pre-rRNA-processing protein ESF1-like, partial [Trifolium pratense]